MERGAVLSHCGDGTSSPHKRTKCIEEKEEPSMLDKLPAEIEFMIIHQLNDVDAVFARLVCHRWHDWLKKNMQGKPRLQQELLVGPKLCLELARRGDLRLLCWVREQGCQWDSETCALAAQGGHLEVLQWARANGAPWNVSVCSNAAENGHLEVLQWAQANGAPWNEYVCYWAAGNGHLEVLQWARANGAPWDEGVCYGAAKNGHLEVLQWARANGAP